MSDEMNARSHQRMATMTGQLVTIGAFATPLEARLAQNYLEAAGIQSFLADEFTIGTASYLSNAIGGVKLRVEQARSREALEILAKNPRSADQRTRE